MLRIFLGLLLTSRMLAEPTFLQALPSMGMSSYVPPPDQWAGLMRQPFTETHALHALPGGAKIGWSSLVVTRPDAQTLRLQTSTQYRYQLGAGTFVQRCKETWNFAAQAPYALRAASQERWLQQQKLTTTLTRVGEGEYRVEITEAGETRRATFSNLQLTALDRLGARLWANAAARRRGDCQAFRGFDLQTLEPFSERHCMVRVASDESLAEVLSENLQGHFPFHYELLPNGQLGNAVLADATELRPVSAEEAPRLEDVPDLFTRSLLPTNRPLGANLRAGRNLVFTLHGPGLKDLPRTGSQKVKLDAAGQSAVLHTGRGAGVPMPATPEEIREALALTLALPWNDARVQRLAQSACEGARTPQEKVRRLLKKVRDTITADDRWKPIGLISLLKNPRGDCTAHTLLFTALARAAGIPCRETSGYLYLSDAAQAFGGHAWNEVVLEGIWHPVDPTWNQFDLDAGHLQLSTGTPTLHDAQYFRGDLTLCVE